MRKLLIVLFLLFLLPLVSADDSKRQSVPLNISHTVTIAGVPTTSASCNITVFDPDNIIIVQFQPMTVDSNSKTYNFLLNSSQNSKIGDLCYDISCAGNSLNNTQHFCIPITTTGKGYTTADSITNLFILIISISLFILFIYLGMKVDTSPLRTSLGEIIDVRLFNKQIKIFFYLLAYMTFTWLMFITWNLTLGYSQLLAVSSFFWFLHRFFIVALPGVLVFYFIMGIMYLLRGLSDQKKIRQGLNLE